VEPFAGGAGYSCRYPDLNVVLAEKNPQIANIWKWLISVPPETISALPIHEPGELIPSEVTGPARDWIGMWNSISVVRPNQRMSPSANKVYMTGGGKNPNTLRRCFWSAEIRDRSAEAVQRIRHWIVIEGDHTSVPTDLDATWFIDPPYQHLDLYKQGALDYHSLALWCLTLRGQIIVCENEGADWLPFQPFGNFHASPRANKSSRRSKEMICTWVNE
jgi:hypothetical protein